MGDGERKEDVQRLMGSRMGEMSVTQDLDLLMVSGVNTYTEIKDITELVQIT